MQDTQDPNEAANIVGIRGELHQRLGRRAEQDVIEVLLVPPDEFPQLVGHGEDDVKVGDRQEFLKIKLTDILVSGVQHSGGVGIVTESFSLSFASALISAADDKGQFTSASTCGAASFNELKEPPIISEKK